MRLLGCDRSGAPKPAKNVAFSKIPTVEYFLSPIFKIVSVSIGQFGGQASGGKSFASQFSGGGLEDWQRSSFSSFADRSERPG
jgi:hypothetical protein